MDQGKKIIVRQVRGVAGRNQRVRDTLKALGLGRVGREREHVANPALMGMIEQVRYLVQVLPVA